jgi:hypothetical protein
MLPVVPDPREGYEAVVFARDQKEYHPLPANTNGAYVETKWQLSDEECLELFTTGYLWLTLRTFGEPLQPIMMSVGRMPVSI